MKLKDIRAKSDIELQKQLAVSREKLRDLKFKDANKQIKNVKSINKHKKTIARVLTILNERSRLDKAQKPQKEQENKDK